MRSGSLSAEQRLLLDRLLDKKGIGRGGDGSVPAGPGPVTGDRSALPLSYAQQRIWYLSRMLPDAIIYNVAGAARLRGRLDPAILRRCMLEIVRRHEVLRTTYHPGEDGKGVQKVREVSDVPLPVVDLRDIAEAEREAAASERARQEIVRPFDLEHDLMLRPVLLRLADNEHLLVLCQHHVATDGWSLGVLIREVEELYSAFAAGLEPALRPLPIQYGDFAVWHRQWLAGERLERQLEYWRGQLADTRLVDVGTGLPRATALTFDGGTLEYRLPADLWRGLSRLADSERATPYMALLAAYAIVLARWSGQDDIIIGCPIAGRTTSEVEPLIGCFLNELPIRLNLSGEPTYRDLLRQARTVSLEAYAHQDVPFEKIVEEVNPERDAMSHAPLVRHQLGLHNEPQWRADLPELTMELATLSTNTSRFDLEVDLSVDPSGGLHGMIYYSTDLYTEAVVLRMLDRLSTVVAGAVADPDRPFSRLPLLGARELHAVTAELAGSPAAPPAEPATVHALIEHWARATPDAVAVTEDGESWSYRDLDARASQLSWWLRHLGVVPDRPVAVCLPPSALQVIALLAVLKAGGAAVPLDPSYPGAQVRAALADAGARLVLTDATTLLEAALGLSDVDPAVRMIALDTVQERLDAYPRERPEPVASAPDLALLSYGPGASGELAGLANTHAGVVSRLRWMAGAFPLAPADGVLARPARALDCSPADMLWPLAAGARLVVPPPAAQPGDLATVIRSGRVAAARMTPMALAALLSGPDVEACRATLRQVILDGERPWPALLALASELLPGARVATIGGSPEAAADMIVVSATGAERPASGVRTLILDQHGEVVPIGVPGEACLGAACLPRGVWRNPAATADRLVPDPTVTAGRLYRTGQRARWLADGGLDLLGTADDVLTIKGHRVELSELAACLSSQSEVERGAVVSSPAPDGGEAELTGYFTLRPDQAHDRDDPASRRRMFEERYGGRAAEDDPALNLGGWTSPSTGEFLSAAQMREWSEATFHRIMELPHQDVLEIGCRTGSLLFRLAPRCGGYVATDLSARALNRIRQHQDWLATKAESVRLIERAPDDFSGFADASFDTVVLNGVVQYFPDLGYLEHVLREAVRVVRDGGAIFLGDVRSLPLLRALHLSAPWGELDPSAPAGQLTREVDRRAAQEEELAVAPDAFRHIAARVAGVTGVSLLPKLGRSRNELTLFRYDAVLHVGGGPPRDDDGTVLHWVADGLTPARLKELLGSAATQPLTVRSVPDGRLRTKLQAVSLLDAGRVATVGELTESIEPARAAPGGPADPVTLVAIGRDLGCGATVQYSAGGATGTVDVVLRPAGPPAAACPATGDRPPSRSGCLEGAHDAPATWTNDPVRAARIRALRPRVRAHLQAFFPTYMIPSRLMVVEQWPARPDGTLDRRALPLPVAMADARAAGHQEPSTETERAIAKIWADALGLDHISIHDDFFSLGGHSLLGAEVVEKVRDLYDIDLPLGRLFESPTVAASAEYIDGARAAGPREVPRAAGIQQIDRSAYQTRRARQAV